MNITNWKKFIDCRIMQLDEYYRQGIINQYGSIDAFIARMMKSEDKIRESAARYYGSFDKYIESIKLSPLPKAGMGKLQIEFGAIIKQITAHKGHDVSDPEIQKTCR